jgi:hypothetical protein
MIEYTDSDTARVAELPDAVWSFADWTAMFLVENQQHVAAPAASPPSGARQAVLGEPRGGMVQ